MEQSLSQKRNIANFVHDVMNMQAAIYTIDQTIQQLREDREAQLVPARDKLAEAERNYRSREWELERLTNPDTGRSQRHLSWGWKDILEVIGSFLFLFLAGLVGAFLPCIVVALVLGLILIIGGFIFSETLGYWGVAIWNNLIMSTIIIDIIPAFILAIVNTSDRRGKGIFDKIKDVRSKKKSSKKEEQAQRVQQARDNLENARIKLQVAQNTMASAEIAAQATAQQIQYLVSKHHEISNHLKQFFSFGIIPPDYRTMDCIIMLDQIFRNNLADDMRSAILLYEERVFRGEVIRGMDRIVAQLDQLSGSMSAISYQLNAINSNISRLCDDQSLANANTERLIQETRLGRYATEQLNSSTERLVYYAEEYKAGRL